MKHEILTSHLEKEVDVDCYESLIDIHNLLLRDCAIVLTAGIHDRLLEEFYDELRVELRRMVHEA